MAKTANNDKGKSGKGKPTPRQAQGGKAVAKRAAAKPARGKGQQKSRQQARAAKPGEKRGLMKFMHDVRIEMGKVTWPQRPELIQATSVVIVAVAIAAVYIGLLDLVWSSLVNLARLS